MFGSSSKKIFRHSGAFGIQTNSVEANEDNKRRVREGRAPTTKHWHKKTPQCEVCGVKFKSMFSKHHCRACGRCVCSTCSSFKDYFETLDKKQRICSTCVTASQDQLVDLWNQVLDEESVVDEVFDLAIRKAKACSSSSGSSSQSTPKQNVVEINDKQRREQSRNTSLSILSPLSPTPPPRPSKAVPPPPLRPQSS